MRIERLIGALGLLAFVWTPWAWAEPAEDETAVAERRSMVSRLKYQTGQINLHDGLATITLTNAFRYLDPAGSDTLLTGIWGNPPSHDKGLGAITPADFDPLAPEAWCIIVSYDEDGYVKDDDAASIDYADLLKQMQDGTREASKERVKDGYPAVDLVGWAAKPSYDRQTHKFYWAKELKFGDSDEENTLNYDLRILGRGGVLVLRIVASMSQLAEIEAKVPEVLGMVEFDAGKRYADYTPGTDKVATYGLAALVAGGVAAKTGFFKALLVALVAMKKFVVVGVLALVGLLRKLFAKKAAAS